MVNNSGIPKTRIVSQQGQIELSKRAKKQKGQINAFRRQNLTKFKKIVNKKIKDPTIKEALLTGKTSGLTSLQLNTAYQELGIREGLNPAQMGGLVLAGIAVIIGGVVVFMPGEDNVAPPAQAPTEKRQNLTQEEFNQTSHAQGQNKKNILNAQQEVVKSNQAQEAKVTPESVKIEISGRPYHIISAQRRMKSPERVIDTNKKLDGYTVYAPGLNGVGNAAMRKIEIYLTGDDNKFLFEITNANGKVNEYNIYDKDDSKAILDLVQKIANGQIKTNFTEAEIAEALSNGQQNFVKGWDQAQGNSNGPDLTQGNKLFDEINNKLRAPGTKIINISHFKKNTIVIKGSGNNDFTSITYIGDKDTPDSFSMAFRRGSMDSLLKPGTEGTIFVNVDKDKVSAQIKEMINAK